MKKLGIKKTSVRLKSASKSVVSLNPNKILWTLQEKSLSIHKQGHHFEEMLSTPT